MIGYLRGTVLSKKTNAVLIDVQGVGYELQMPLSNFCSLAHESAVVSVFVLTYVREDCIKLFGFASFFERAVFEMLTTVSGIGPKAALALMGPVSGKPLCQAIISKDLAFLTRIPGIGQKTAERLLVELQGKAQKLLASAKDLEKGVASASPRATSVNPGAQAEYLGNPIWDLDPTQPGDTALFWEDLESALVNMGYTLKQVAPVIKQIQNSRSVDAPFSLESSLREALRALVGGKATSLHL
jgi:Holliday junction DNA helicase RuvA